MEAATFTPIYSSNKEFDIIYELVSKTYDEACIITMNKINNPYLEEQYEIQRALLLSEGKSVEEKLLYHGTNAIFASKIINEGFDPSKNKCSAYGKGTYFALKANYSKEYSIPKPNGVSQLLICRVLIGKCIVGHSNEIIPKGYDNMVDNLINPQIYVTPYRYGAIPTYLLDIDKTATKKVDPFPNKIKKPFVRFTSYYYG